MVFSYQRDVPQDPVHLLRITLNISITMEGIISNHTPTPDGELSLQSSGDYSSFIWAVVAISTFWYIVNYYTNGKSTSALHNHIPNGPSGLPIVGELSDPQPTNAHNILITSIRLMKRYLGSFPFLTHYPELTLDKWAKKFGDLYSIWLGNQLFVIVSSPTIAKDLMVTNGAVFSSRKEMFIKSQTVFAGRGITATPYNDRWLVPSSPFKPVPRTN